MAEDSFLKKLCCAEFFLANIFVIEFGLNTTTRAATEPVDPVDSDLFTTRNRNSRSGSDKKIFLLNLEQKFGNFKFV